MTINKFFAVDPRDVSAVSVNQDNQLEIILSLGTPHRVIIGDPLPDDEEQGASMAEALANIVRASAN
jgi:hypothetical protein